MNTDFSRLCRIVGDMYHVQVRAASLEDAMLVYPEQKYLFSTDQFFSCEEFRSFLANLTSKLPYRLIDRLGMEWVLFVLEEHAVIVGPMLSKIMTRLETKALFRHCFGSSRKRVYFYEGEDQQERAFREYTMRLPLINKPQQRKIVAFLFQYLADITPDSEEVIDLLDFDPYAAKDTDISKYVSYYEDCEAALTACVAHSGTDRVREIVNTLFEQGTSRDANNWRYGFYGFASIAMLSRMGARRAGVAAATSERTNQQFMDRALQTDTAAELQEIAAEMAEAFCELSHSSNNVNHSVTVNTIIDRIKTGFAEKLSAGSIAEELGLNASYMATSFKKETGMTVTEYINVTRLEYARTMLTLSGLDISEICSRCGIPDQSYFSKLFKQQYGLTPSQYKLKLLGKQAVSSSSQV